MKIQEKCGNKGSLILKNAVSKIISLHFERVVPKMATFVNKFAMGRFDQKVL